MEAAIRRSHLGAYLSQVHSFLSMQRRSPYVNKMKGAGEGVELLPGEGKYLFVYPFTKTRSWYRLSPHARQGFRRVSLVEQVVHDGFAGDVGPRAPFAQSVLPVRAFRHDDDVFGALAHGRSVLEAAAKRERAASDPKLHRLAR